MDFKHILQKFDCLELLTTLYFITVCFSKYEECSPRSPKNYLYYIYSTQSRCEVGDGLPFAKFNQNSKLRLAKQKKYHIDFDIVSPKIILIFTLSRQ